MADACSKTDLIANGQYKETRSSVVAFGNILDDRPKSE